MWNRQNEAFVNQQNSIQAEQVVLDTIVILPPHRQHPQNAYNNHNDPQIANNNLQLQIPQIANSNLPQIDYTQFPPNFFRHSQTGTGFRPGQNYNSK